MATGSQNMTTFKAKGLTSIANAVDTSNFIFLKSTALTADQLGNTVSLSLNAATVTGAAVANHSLFLNAGIGSGIETPFQLQIPDSSHLYIYKRWYTSGAWSGWSKLSAGHADTAAALESDAGGTEQPIYFTGGKPAATSYALKATVNNGDTNYVAYYSGARAITSAKATTAMIMPAHYYHNLYDNNPTTGTTVYVHYYNGNTTSTNTFANLRVKSGSTFKTLVFGGDGTFTWNGINVVINSGTWGISITGNAATATKLSNTPNNTTTFLRGDNTWSNTLTDEYISTSANGFRIKQGSYGVFLRNDGSNTYILLTNSGDQAGNWNNLRPFYINNSSGMLHSENGQTFSGGQYFTGKTWIGRSSAGTAHADVLEVRSAYTDNDHWAMCIKNEYNANATGWGTGLKIANGSEGETGKWIGIRAYADSAYSNSTVMDFYSVGAHRMRLASDRLIPITDNTYYLGESSHRWASVYAVNFVGNASTATDADKLDGLHANQFAKSMSPERTFNDIAQNENSALGMIFTNTGPESGSTWYHFIQMNYNNNAGASGNTGNFWCAQIANKPGATNPYIRSRSGGNDISTGWSNWATILTSTNYTNYTVTKTGSGASGSWGISVTGSAGSVAWGNVSGRPTIDKTTTIYQISRGANFDPIQSGYFAGMSTSTGISTSWWHILSMDWSGNDANNWISQLAIPTENRTGVYYRSRQNSTTYTWKKLWTEGESITGAVWNDYAEVRTAQGEPGQVVYELGDDTCIPTTERLQHFAGIVSDTWGFSQGETDSAKTHIAVAGRVLAYPYHNRDEYKPGDVLCAAPGGTVDIMTREEVIQYPDRIVGTVSCVPEYEEWGGSNLEIENRPPVKVNGRIWVKVK